MSDPSEILENWPLKLPVRPSQDGGLINDTYIVGEPPVAILQRVNPIFDPEVHKDIEAITSHLDKNGMLTPRLMPTRDGALCVPTASGAWRMLTFVPGTTHHTIANLQQAASAAHLVGRFHRMTERLEHQFHFSRPGAHDTVQHMQTLTEAIGEEDGDITRQGAKALGSQILDAWSQWDGALSLPLRICHGDLKISNLRFDEQGNEAICLLDFDTFAHQTIAVEMGDAWRSWCNPAGEDHVDAIHFDLDIFSASAKAWLAAGPHLSKEERENLVPGIERICLELSARFCADAIRQCYFKEDRSRFSAPGAHNLHRAQGQFRLAASVREQRLKAETIIQTA
jgi:hypothetical protein